MRRWSLALWAAALVSPGMAVHAQEFSALVSPPRFEGPAVAGGTYRDVIEITNVSGSAAKYYLRTTDWELDASGQAVFQDDLKPNSCRPWAALERREIQVPAGGKYRFRFEVAVPANAPVGECRLAIMLEGEPQTVGAGNVSIPVSGRLGIIVYVAVGGAKPSFQIDGTARTPVESIERPALRLKNVGNAHGRLEGFIDAVDAKGTKITFTPSNLPILAGETRVVPLAPLQEKGMAEPKVVYPLTLKGKIDWNNQRLDVDGVAIP